MRVSRQGVAHGKSCTVFDAEGEIRRTLLRQCPPLARVADDEGSLAWIALVAGADL
jgi:hypothetical protein